MSPVMTSGPWKSFSKIIPDICICFQSCQEEQQKQNNNKNLETWLKSVWRETKGIAEVSFGWQDCEFLHA